MQGGSDRSTFFDDVWVLDLDKMRWIPIHKEIEKEKEKEKEKEREKEGEKGKEKVSDDSASIQKKGDGYWPSPRRDHAAAVYSNRYYIMGGKDIKYYAWDYLSSFACGTVSLFLSFSSSPLSCVLLNFRLDMLTIYYASDPLKTLLLRHPDRSRLGYVYTCGYGKHGQVETN